MKILLLITALICTCNGGIPNGYGGNAVHEIEIEPQQLQHIHQLQLVEHGHHHNAPVAPVEIIKIQSAESVGGYGAGGHGASQSEWQPINDIHSHNLEPQIIKIIHEEEQHSHGRHNDHGFGGQSQPQIIQIIEEPSHGNGHGNNAGPLSPHQIVKIIEEQSYGGHGNNAHAHNFGGHGSPSQSEPQIIFADPPPSRPLKQNPNTSSKSSNPLSSLGSIIPRLIKFLFGGGNSQQSSSPSLNSHSPINTPHAGQLTNAYGYGGTAKITRAGKMLNSFYNSGRVIESGTLKISSVKSSGKW